MLKKRVGRCLNVSFILVPMFLLLGGFLFPGCSCTLFSDMQENRAHRGLGVSCSPDAAAPAQKRRLNGRKKRQRKKRAS